MVVNLTPSPSDQPLLDAEAWPDTQPAMYRSEGFAEDLDAGASLGFVLDPAPDEPLRD